MKRDTKAKRDRSKSKGPRRTTMFRRLDVRLMAGVLAVSISMMAGIAVLLVSHSSTSLTGAAQDKAESLSRTVALRLEDWVTERHGELGVIAGRSINNESGSATQGLVEEVDAKFGDYVVIEITDLAGKVQSASKPGVKIDPTAASWFRLAASGQAITSTPIERDGHIDWAVAEPILGQDGKPEGVVIGYLQTIVLVDLLNPELDNGTAVVAVDANHQLIYDTAMGKVADDAALLAAGSLSTTVENDAVARGLSGELGSATFTDLHGKEVIGGFDPVEEVNWVVIAQEPKTETLAPVTAQRNRALELILIGTLLAVAFAIAFARWIVRPLQVLTVTAGQVAAGRLDVRRARRRWSTSARRSTR
jgi:methyl-accepting chemotaxis protein